MRTSIAHIKNNLYEIDIEYELEPIKVLTQPQPGIGIWYYDSDQNRIGQWEIIERSLINRMGFTTNYHIVVASSKPLWRWWVESSDAAWSTSPVPRIIARKFNI